MTASGLNRGIIYMNYKDYKNRKIADSFKDAARGLWMCIKNERNMRIHTAAAAYVLFFAPFLGVSRGEYAVLCAVIALMITAEAFNTAIENLCDFACKKQNRFIGATKDIAAGAVLISALFAACTGVVLLFRPEEILALIAGICRSPLYIILFAGSVIVSLIYIIKGPVGIKRWFEKDTAEAAKLKPKR